MCCRPTQKEVALTTVKLITFLKKEKKMFIFPLTPQQFLRDYIANNLNQFIVALLM